MFFKKKTPPAKIRRCSICGGTGHDQRNCPEKSQKSPRDTAVWIKYDNITNSQADKVVTENKKIKDKYLDSDARVTSVKAKQKDLPKEVRKRLFG